MAYALDCVALEQINREQGRRNEEVTITLKRGTVEAILRDSRGESHPDVLFGLPLPKKKACQVMQEAKDDLVSACKDARSAKKKKGRKK